MGHGNVYEKVVFSTIATPLGGMKIIADDMYLYLLLFEDQQGVDQASSKILNFFCDYTAQGSTKIIKQVQNELEGYFSGTLKNFTVPVSFLGTEFQKSVWQQLLTIPYGETSSYQALAVKVMNPQACRAVGSANGANLISIIVPCHRVINASGKLGGYAGGCVRKQKLLQHESLSLY